MRRSALGGSLTFGITIGLLLVFGTFALALITGESKAIPGVVEVSVVSSASEASAEIAWGIGLPILILAISGFAFTLGVVLRRSDD